MALVICMVLSTLLMRSLMSFMEPAMRDVYKRQFRGQVHLYVLNFLKILCENGTLRELPGCARAYRIRYNAAHGILDHHLPGRRPGGNGQKD